MPNETESRWDHFFHLLQAVLAVAALVLVTWTLDGAIAAANEITPGPEKAEAFHKVLETLLSWKVVSGLGVLVTIPKVPAMIRALKG